MSDNPKRLVQEMHDHCGDKILVAAAPLCVEIDFQLEDENVSMIFKKKHLDEYIAMLQKAREVME